MTTPKEELRQLVMDLAVKRGEFILASGRKSSYYIDARLVTLHPQGAHLVGRVILQELSRAGLLSELDAVAGMTLGADPMVTAVAMESRQFEGAKPVFAAIVRKETKDHGTGRKVEGPISAGMKVAVLEDTSTTGGSAQKAAGALKEMNCEVAVIVSLIDRLEGARENIEKAGFRFMSVFTIKELGL